jgi:hypothetical protein
MRAPLTFLMILALSSLAACAHHDIRVRCDATLTPINRPAPKAPLADAPAGTGTVAP